VVENARVIDAGPFSNCLANFSLAFSRQAKCGLAPLRETIFMEITWSAQKPSGVGCDG